MSNEHHEATCNCHGEHHNHEHEHQEHHHHIEEKKSRVKIHTHDSSVVASFQIEIDESLAIAEEKIENCLNNIAMAIDECDGIIGHIKAFVQYYGENSMLSITDEEVRKKRGTANRCGSECVAIVFNIEPDHLEKIIESKLI